MSKGSHSFREICTVGDAILMSPGILRIGVVTSKDGTEALDRFPSPLLSTDLTHLGCFHSPIYYRGLTSEASDEPGFPDESGRFSLESGWLLTLVALARNPFNPPKRRVMGLNSIESSMNGLLDLPLTTPPLVELLSTKKQHPPVGQFCLPLPSHQDHGEQLNLANPVIPRQVLFSFFRPTPSWLPPGRLTRLFIAKNWINKLQSTAVSVR